MTYAHAAAQDPLDTELNECGPQHARIEDERNVPEIAVDNIEIAQFIYLMLHNQKIRDAIDTITSKAVLILGRFTDERNGRAGWRSSFATLFSFGCERPL